LAAVSHSPQHMCAYEERPNSLRVLQRRGSGIVQIRPTA
jgi:hypothetical protein